jgi:hypothetical protein
MTYCVNMNANVPLDFPALNRNVFNMQGNDLDRILRSARAGEFATPWPQAPSR